MATEPHDLAATLVNAVSTIQYCVAEWLQRVSDNRKRQSDPKYPDIKEVSKAFIRAFINVTSGLSVLSNIVNEASLVYLEHVVHVYSALLSSLWERIRSSPNPAAIATETSNSRHKIQEKLFIDLLACLRPDCRGSRMVFESTYRTILERVAALIYEIEFGHVKSESVWVDIPLCVENHPAGVARTTPNDVVTKAQEESRRIFPVFRAAYSLSEEFFLSATNLEGQSRPTSNIEQQCIAQRQMAGPDMNSIHINPSSLRILQETLVRCLRQSVGDEKTESKDIFRYAPIPEPLPACPPPLENWSFVEEVWKLIGWDLLVADFE
jgi:hypothetical protein